MDMEREAPTSPRSVDDERNARPRNRDTERMSYWRRAREVFEDEVITTGPTDDEVEAWAERERRRRQKWAEGPTEEEKMAWALREHRRRSARAGDSDKPADSGERRMRRASREAELAAVGAWDLFMEFPWRVWDTLVDEGREREAEAFSARRRRRVRYYDDDY